MVDIDLLLTGKRLSTEFDVPEGQALIPCAEFGSELIILSLGFIVLIFESIIGAV
jgi:hypothetical protein